MKKVLIISDTHGLLRDEVKAEMAVSDYIIHGGDINNPSVLQTLNEQGNLFVVRGNNDKEWAEDLPKILTIEIEDVQILIVHNKKDVPKELTDIDIVIYGHSHKYEEKVIDGVLWLNPGSCGKRRFDLEISMCRMVIEHGEYRHEKLVIPNIKTV